MSSITSFRRTVFYAIERTIKEYRRFALAALQQHFPDLTVNQGLLLSLVAEAPDISQVEMADILFKDVAAITRMVESLVKRGYLKRVPHPKDRRRNVIALTQEGEATVHKLTNIIRQNRTQALHGLNTKEQRELLRLLEKITLNCQNP